MFFTKSSTCNRNVLYACFPPLHICVCGSVCVCGVMWCLAWETQQGFCSVALQSDGGGSRGGQAVITNSIHFRNNNTALRVNRGLFSSGSHWSARAKDSTHLLSLAVTSQDGAPTAALIFSFWTLHTRTQDRIVNLNLKKSIFTSKECNYINVLVCPFVGPFKLNDISSILKVIKMYLKREHIELQNITFFFSGQCTPLQGKASLLI